MDGPCKQYEVFATTQLVIVFCLTSAASELFSITLCFYDNRQNVLENACGGELGLNDNKRPRLKIAEPEIANDYLLPS